MKKTTKKVELNVASEDAVREIVRQEVRAAVAEALESVAPVDQLEKATRAARELTTEIFGLNAHKAQIEGLQNQATTAVKFAAELRQEWLNAKYLAKVFEQRQFLRSDTANEIRRALTGTDGTRLRELGAGLTTLLETMKSQKSLQQLEAEMHQASPEDREHWMSEGAKDVTNGTT